MIEINLIPDVKQELIKAKRVRTMVVSGAIVVGIVSIGLVVLLAVYLFGVQTLRSAIADGQINDKYTKLKNTQDLANMLTIQNQLASVNQLHDEKNIDSRVFELLTAVNPAKPNQITYNQVRVDAETNTIHIDGQAANGFVAADVLKKTLLGASYTFDDGDSTKTEKLADNVAVSDLSYGEDSTGAKVLRFSVEFEYKQSLFARSSKNLIVSRPERQNATDSFKYLPESLFGDRASDIGGGQ